MSDYKVILRDIVELFYQSPFKIFNVNSSDGETLVKPFGYFISLGITTPIESLKKIRDIINKSDYGFSSRIVELKSVKSEEYGDYLNILSDIPEDKICKYPSIPPTDTKVLGKEECMNLLESLGGDGEYSAEPLRNKIVEIINKIDDWDNYGLLLKDSQPGIFHKFINYQKRGNNEFRIGIYVTKL